MSSKFSDVLEAVEELPIDEKEMLVDILQNRLTENRRKQLQTDIKESRLDFDKGLCKPQTADEIMQEVLS